jgi:hypothetical protein
VATGAAQNVDVANSYFTTGATVDVLADVFGYFAPSTAVATYMVTGGGTVPVSTFSCVGIGSCEFGSSIHAGLANGTLVSDNAGFVTYTATGFAAGASVNIALFPSTGSNAPVQPDIFTSASAPAAGAAAGEDFTNTDSGYIYSVNGVYEDAYSPPEVDGVAPVNGAVTFIVDSFYADGAIPVVWTGPATSTPLMVNANGTPQTGYEVGIGLPTTWTAVAATTGIYDGWIVQTVNLTAQTFQACDSQETYANCATFTWGASGSTYNYAAYDDNNDPPLVGTTLSLVQFAEFLSGPTTPFGYYGSTTPPQLSNGDKLYISYNSSGPSTFTYLRDAPAAPTAVAATYSATTPATSYQYPHFAGGPGNIVTWTAPANYDMVNATYDGDSWYEIYRATLTAGTYDWSTATDLGYVYASEAIPTTFVDGTATAAGTYEYEVQANSFGPSDDYSYRYGHSPYSASSNALTVVAPVIPAPVIVTVVISTNTALVTYNEDVSCATGAGLQFTYSDTAGVHNLVGTACAETTATELNIALPAPYSAVTGDTFTYTAPPTLQTVATSVYAGPTGSPVYAATQTVTDDGSLTSPLQ